VPRQLTGSATGDGDGDARFEFGLDVLLTGLSSVKA